MIPTRGSRREGREAEERAPAPVSRPGRFLWLLLLLPGGLLLLAGIFVASVGVALCWPWLRSLAGASRTTRGVVAGDARPSSGTLVPGPLQQPFGALRDSGRRVPWAACGERGSSTGEPPVWLGQGGTC